MNKPSEIVNANTTIAVDLANTLADALNGLREIRVEDQLAAVWLLIAGMYCPDDASSPMINGFVRAVSEAAMAISEPLFERPSSGTAVASKQHIH